MSKRDVLFNEHNTPMTDTTTIEITTEQNAELDRLKDAGGYQSKKAVLDELLTESDVQVAGVDAAEAKEIAQETVRDMVLWEALEQ